MAGVLDSASTVNEPSADTFAVVATPFWNSVTCAPAGTLPVTWDDSSIHWNV